MASRWTFLDAQRAVPSLSRGWRTPDPSPTRNAEGLPRCKPSELCFTGSSAEIAQDAETPRHCRSKEVQMGGCESDRTLSPPMLCSPAEVATNDVQAPRVQDRTPSPSNNSDTAHLFLPEMALEDVQALAMGGMWSIPICDPCGTPQMMIPWAPVSYAVAPGNWEQITHLSGEAEQLPDVIVSAGSKGHPLCCAEPCKYQNKLRGCKDGATCDHCHLCEWKPARGRKNAPRGTRKGTGRSAGAKTQCSA
jgi:hypothetical protein